MRHVLLSMDAMRELPAWQAPSAAVQRRAGVLPGRNESPRVQMLVHTPRPPCTCIESATRSDRRRGRVSRRGTGSDVEEKATRRGNYESGSDYVLEYGELRFSFNEEDFAQRVEQAAVKLNFVDQGLSDEELQDLLDLAVNGEIGEPSSALGEHINQNWDELVGPANRSLVHWIRRLVFRGAWLDQRVKEGELDVVFDQDSQSFGYVQPERGSELIELSKEPSWRRISYRR